MIGVIVPYLSKIRRSYQSNDLIDRLSYEYTAMIITLAAFTLAATQYVGNPIQCWVPAQFTGAWEKYTETYCFIKGSYFLPLDDDIPYEFNQREDAVIGYYQWVPIVLALQAFLFYFPSLVWKSLNFKTGINVKGVLNSAASVKKKFDRGSRIAQVHIAADHLQEALDMQRELKGGFDCLRFGKRNGVYLVALYLFTKLLYVLNVLMQFVILNAFLGPQYTFWGAGILSDIWNGKEWNESGHFPRVTMCDFDVRVMGNIHRWTVQCVLMINMFNEKIYIFLWWWFVLVGILTIISFFYYVIALTVATNQRQFVTRYLRCTGAISKQSNSRNDDHLNSFINKFLRPDGVFLLRLIESNGGDLLVGEVVSALFNRYRARMEDHLDTLPVTESPNSSASIHHN